MPATLVAPLSPPCVVVGWFPQGFATFQRFRVPERGKNMVRATLGPFSHVFRKGLKTTKRLQKRVIGAHHRALFGATPCAMHIFQFLLGGPDGPRACFGFTMKTNGFHIFMPEGRLKKRRPNRPRKAKGCNNVEKVSDFHKVFGPCLVATWGGGFSCLLVYCA